MTSLSRAAAASLNALAMTLVFAGPVRAEANQVLNLEETVITADSPDEIALYALPINASAQLVQQRGAVDEARKAFDAARLEVSRALNELDFDAAPGSSEKVTAALVVYREKMAALEDVEGAYLLDKEVFVADQHSARVQPVAAKARAATSHVASK